MERYDIEYDNNRNIVHWRDLYNNEFQLEFNKNNLCIHFCQINDIHRYDNYEAWYKYSENNEQINITKQILKEKEYKRKEKTSRIEIMKI